MEAVMVVIIMGVEYMEEETTTVAETIMEGEVMVAVVKEVMEETEMEITTTTEARTTTIITSSLKL